MNHTSLFVGWPFTPKLTQLRIFGRIKRDAENPILSSRKSLSLFTRPDHANLSPFSGQIQTESESAVQGSIQKQKFTGFEPGRNIAGHFARTHDEGRSFGKCR